MNLHTIYIETARRIHRRPRPDSPARLLRNYHSGFACDVIAEVERERAGGVGKTAAYARFAEMFEPDDGVGYGRYGMSWFESKNDRLLALCFMAAMAGAGDL